MKLDPTKMKDWQVAEAAEETMKPVRQLADELGLKEDELLPMGLQLGKVDYMKVLNRLKDAPSAKYIDVTAITPTPLGEGKTTTGIGLIEGLGKLGKRVVGAIRQPSGGPTFNIKGSAAGGGLAQCIPLTPFSIRLTGDIVPLAVSIFSSVSSSPVGPLIRAHAPTTLVSHAPCPSPGLAVSARGLGWRRRPHRPAD